MSVEELYRLAADVFVAWPWGKIRIDAEKLEAAAMLFDRGRLNAA